jgi:Trk K+ transport system NAD-binding subunit
VRGGHVVVCGLRGVGLRTVELLHGSGVPVVVVTDESDRRLSRVVQSWGVPTVQGNARLGEGLEEAGLDTAAAVICVDTDDLVTLETAIRVKEVAPETRLVVQLANPAVGAALARVSDRISVLDAAAIAAPAFVEACLHQGAHDIELAGEVFTVVEVVVGSEEGFNPTFRSHFANLAPVAIVPADGGDMALCPGRDHPVHAGDRVTVVGTRDELQRHGVDAGRSGPAAVSVPLRLRIARRVRAARETNSAGLPIALAAMALLMVVAVLVIHFAYIDPTTQRHLGLVNSLYFAVETVATVGFGDYSFAGQRIALVVFAVAFIALGVFLVTVCFALFTNILVSRRIEQSLGRGRVPGMAGHVVVVGLGSIGIRVVEGLLAAGRKVVVIERDEANRYLGRARALDVPVVIADATERQTHVSVNLADAAAVAVLTSADLTNVETGLAVTEHLGERRHPVPVVLRVFDRHLARTVERDFGFRHVRSTSALAAPWFVGAALGLDVIETFYVENQPFLVGRLVIVPGGGLESRRLDELSASTRVVALRRPDGTLEHPPRRDTRFQGGDQAYIIGPYEELLAVLRRGHRPA